MAGNVTPNRVIEYVAKASPTFPFTLTDDQGAPVNLTGATISAYFYCLTFNTNVQSIAKMLGTFTITNAAAGKASYQWTLIDLNVPGGFQMYISAKLPSEPYQREFNPVNVAILPTPEYLGGIYVQEVDLNVNGAPNTALNPMYADVIDRVARVLGHVIIDSMPAISGTVTANAGTNLNTSALALEAGGHLAAIDTNTSNTSTHLTDGTGKIKPQVAAADVSTSNPLPTTSGQVGLIAPYGSNAATTGIATDTPFKWGSGGTTTVQRVAISNETGADVRYEFDSAATANSLRLKDGLVLFVAQPTSAVHFYTAASQNINQAGGVMIRGYN